MAQSKFSNELARCVSQVRIEIAKCDGLKNHTYETAPWNETGVYYVYDLFDQDWEPVLPNNFSPYGYDLTDNQICNALVSWRYIIKKLTDNAADPCQVKIDIIAFLRYFVAGDMTESIMRDIMLLSPKDHFPCPACSKHLANRVDLGLGWPMCVGGFNRAQWQYLEPTKAYYALVQDDTGLGKRKITRLVAWALKHDDSVFATWCRFKHDLEDHKSMLDAYYHPVQQFNHAHVHVFHGEKLFTLEGMKFTALGFSMLNQLTTITKVCAKRRNNRWWAKHFWSDIPLPLDHSIDALDASGELWLLALFALYCLKNSFIAVKSLDRHVIARTIVEWKHRNESALASMCQYLRLTRRIPISAAMLDAMTKLDQLAAIDGYYTVGLTPEVCRCLTKHKHVGEDFKDRWDFLFELKSDCLRCKWLGENCHPDGLDSSDDDDLDVNDMPPLVFGNDNLDLRPTHTAQDLYHAFAAWKFIKESDFTTFDGQCVPTGKLEIDKLPDHSGYPNE